MMRGASLTTHFEPLHKLRAHAGAVVLKCLLSPDVRQLATTSSDKSVKLWNIDGFTLDRTLTGAHAPCAGALITHPLLTKHRRMLWAYRRCTQVGQSGMCWRIGLVCGILCYSPVSMQQRRL